MSFSCPCTAAPVHQCATAMAADVVGPGVYGIKVQPGPSWDFLDENKGEGTVVHLSDDILQDWAKEVCSENLQGKRGTGGWSPTRSAAVHWSGAKHETIHYYKCGDDGLYDLCTVECPTKPHFDKVDLHLAVCKFCTLVKRNVLTSTRVPVGSNKQSWLQVQILIDEEWGRFNRLLYAHGHARPLQAKRKRLRGKVAPNAQQSSCTLRVYLMEDEVRVLLGPCTGCTPAPSPCTGAPQRWLLLWLGLVSTASR